MKKNQYDSIIIGGGLSGLICGNYLAKAGQKVLILEKNSYPGGCCCSFRLGKYKMESGIHSIEGYDAYLKPLISDLKLNICFKRKEVTDIILFEDDEKVTISADFDKTLGYFDRVLKTGRADIQNLESMIGASLKETIELNKYGNAKEFINWRFESNLVRKTLLLLTRNIGTPPEYLSAVNFAIFLKAYLKDNGYYLEEGIDAFPAALEESFLKLGGQIQLRSNVEKILIRDGSAVGVKCEEGEYYSKSVVSAGDFVETVEKLLDMGTLAEKARKMKVTVSAFIIYIITPDKIKDKFEETNALWFADSGDFNSNFCPIFEESEQLIIDDKVLMLGFVPNNDNLGMYVTSTARFAVKEVWEERREELAAGILKKLGKRVGINLITDSLLINTATPYTFRRFTNNYKGAVHGWAPLKDQINFSTANRVPIKNLYFTGQWSTGYGQGGIPWVINSAMRTAKTILYKNES